MMGFSLGRIEALRPVEARRPELNRFQDARTAERTKYRQRSTEEGSLTLTTAEGDKVTISFRNRQSAKVDEARFYGPEGSFEKTRVKTRERSELSVSLEGSLSEEELADISALVDKLTGQGDGGDLATIANYQYSYQRTEDWSLKATRVSVMA